MDEREIEVYEALARHFQDVAQEVGGWETEAGMRLDYKITRLAEILCEKAPDVAAFRSAVAN